MTFDTAFYLVLCALTLWLNRWLNAKEIESAKAVFRQDALSSALEIAKEREALAVLARERAEAELEVARTQADNRRNIERNALPFYANSEREMAQIERVMNDKGEDYHDEVAGLGR